LQRAKVRRHWSTSRSKTLGGLHLLINNVGAVRPRTGGFRSTLTLDLLAAVRATRAALPHLLDTAGSIVTLCSVNAFRPDPLVMDYSVAEGALANFSKALSKEVGPRGVRVNTVSPGPVATDLWLVQGGVAEIMARAGGFAPERVANHAALEAAITKPERSRVSSRMGSQRGDARVIRGEPGIGKSALLNVASATAQTRGYRVLTATGVLSEAEHLPPESVHLMAAISTQLALRGSTRADDAPGR
jgi:NAD(P)-dependent dehydrogenase (short-subunit alcohol dehydrogenase family)